jgi:hypothetical protein
MLAVTNAVRSIATFYPEPIRAQIEREMPAISLQTTRLALEVVAAETSGVSFLAAVERPEFPLMARLHFGVLDILQTELPRELRDGVRALLEHAAGGDFDPMRKLLFEVASRQGDPEAALARFLLFQAVRLNLYLNTWTEPQLEAWGSLRRIEERAESIVRELLRVDLMFHPDVRPLHVLVKEALIHLAVDAERIEAALRENVKSFMEKMELLTEAHRVVRELKAADAAVFRPGMTTEGLGSQRIADRFPDHFPSAVDQRRSRFRKRFDPEKPPASPGNRVIDVIFDTLKEGATR